MRRLLVTLLLPLLAVSLGAQSVSWVPSDSGDPSELQLEFDDCSPTTLPTLPAIGGVTLNYIGRSFRSVVTNGVGSQSTVLTYSVSSQSGGSFRIRPFQVVTDKGPLTVPAFDSAAVPPAGSSEVRSSLSAPADTFWAGEVFPLTYTLSMPRRSFNQLGPDIQWTPDPLVVEDWSSPNPVESIVNGEPRLNILYRTEAYAKTPGRIRLNAATQLVSIQNGASGFFGFPRVDQVSVTSNEPELNIRPLPVGAPKDFNGAVGDFTLTAQVVPLTAAVGEPITWTVKLQGTGNWPEIPGLPAREVSKDFQVVQPKARRTTAEGKLFQAELDEDVVLIPTKPGTYQIGPVSYTCFDPQTGKYKTLTTDSATVTITGSAAVAAGTPPSTSLPRVTPGAEQQSPAPLPEEPTGPQAIPGDPIEGPGAALVPMDRTTLVSLLSAPFAALLLCWGGLALQRARLTDPLRSHRAAQAQLRTILQRLKSASVSARSRLLLEWQHQTNRLWHLAHAAPPASALEKDEWRRLWEESDRALYGADGALPADWIGRAESVLSAHRIRGFSPLRLFLPRNLLPFLILATACVLTSISVAADATADYRAGHFADSEKAWRGAVQARPNDWISRYNLSLALAQQQSWPEAAAQATAAFVQHPRDDRLVRDLSTLYPHAGYTPEGLGGFADPGLLLRLAALASPAEWQMVLILGAALIAIAGGLWMFRAYGWRARWVPPVALIALLAGLVLVPAAIYGRHAFGPAGDARAVLAWGDVGILRSVPTEADISQETSPLPAGTIGIADGTFLDWVHLSFANGQTGWVRKTEVLSLWR